MIVKVVLIAKHRYRFLVHSKKTPVIVSKNHGSGFIFCIQKCFYPTKTPIVSLLLAIPSML